MSLFLPEKNYYHGAISPVTEFSMREIFRRMCKEYIVLKKTITFVKYTCKLFTSYEIFLNKYIAELNLWLF